MSEGLAEPPDHVVLPTLPAEDAPPSDMNLDWLERQLERVAELAQAMAANQVVMDAAVERLQRRHARITAPMLAEKERLEANVRLFCEAFRQRLCVGKRKSRELLAGKVGWRLKAERLDILDKDALTRWAAAMALTRTVVTPDMEKVRAHVKKTGEVPEGAVILPATETFFVSTDDEGEA